MSKSIFLDTSPFIYYLENVEPYYPILERFFPLCIEKGILLYTSTVTDTEFLTMPYRKNDVKKIIKYFTLLSELQIQKHPITELIASEGAKIRAKYPNIKTPDALQVATALTCGCDAFLTNDKQLKQIEEINILTLEEV